MNRKKPSRKVDPPSDGERATLLILLAVILFLGDRLAFGPEERIAFLFYDDAYYYLGVARNLAEGAGSTFDGLNATNGYHPLWCWLLVPVFRFTNDPGIALRVVCSLFFLIAAVTPLVVWKALRPGLGGPGACVAAVLFGIHPFLGMALSRPNGLETPLFAVLIATCLYLYRRIGFGTALPPRLGRFIPLGLALGAVTLARFDGGFLAVAVAILVFIKAASKWGFDAALGRVAVVTVVASLLVGPSLAWNTIRFEHPVPVSGRVVALGAESEREELGGATSRDFLRRRAGYALRDIPALIVRGGLEGALPERLEGRFASLLGIVLVLATGILVGLALARRRWRENAHHGSGIGLLLLFAAIHYGVYAGWMWSSGEDWYRLYYFMPEFLALSCLVGVLAGPVLESMSAGLRSLVGAVCLGFLVFHLVTQAFDSSEGIGAEPGPVADRHIYGWIRNELPPGAVLGARNAGKLGYFSGRPVVNLDGLANDHRFLEALREERVDRYICDSSIRYLFHDRAWFGDWDPVRPDVAPGSGTGTIPYRVHRDTACTVREVPGETGAWVVLEVVR